MEKQLEEEKLVVRQEMQQQIAQLQRSVRGLLGRGNGGGRDLKTYACLVCK